MDILTRGGSSILTAMASGCLLMIVARASHQAESIRDWVLEDHGLGPVCEVLIKDKSSHSTAWNAMPTSTAMECMRVKKGRSCLGVSDTAPIYVGRNCSGSRCRLDLYPETSPCMLEAYGVDVQLHNTSRKATCGLSIEDSHWLRPRYSTLEDLNTTSAGQLTLINHSSKLWDLHDLPPGIGIEVWSPCVDGIPSEVIQFTFPDNLGDSYTCVVSPACLHKQFSFHFMCYSTECGGDEMDDLQKSNSKTNLPWFTLIGVVIYITLLILLIA